MKADIQVLQLKLKDFGLNPREWVIVAQKKVGNLFELKIRSRADRDLILQGWAEQEMWLEVSYQG